MKLRDMLDELRNNILRDASDQVSPGDRDQMWDDRTLVRYINEAQERFCLKTSILRDESTAAICTIPLVAGQDSYPLDPRIVSIFNVRIGRRNVRRGTYGGYFSASGDQTTGYDFWDRDVSNTDRDYGPAFFYTDRESQKIGLYPAPGLSLDTLVMTMRVSRLPLNPLTVANLDASPEIPHNHHMDLLEWAAWKCLRNHDVETENIPKGSTHAKRFQEAMDEVNRESKRLSTDIVQFDLRNNWSR